MIHLKLNEPGVTDLYDNRSRDQSSHDACRLCFISCAINLHTIASFLSINWVLIADKEILWIVIIANKN